MAAVVKRGAAQLSGLPACTWSPPKGCTNTTQYECMAGKKAGVEEVVAFSFESCNCEAHPIIGVHY